MAEMTGDWETQMLIWGWAVSGHDPLAVYTCEEPDWGCFYGWWDGDAASLNGRMVSYDDEPYHRPPDHWALPGVTELLVMQNAQSTGALAALNEKAARVASLAEELLQ